MKEGRLPQLTRTEPLVLQEIEMNTSNVSDNTSNLTAVIPVFDEVNMIKTLVMGTMFFVSLFGNMATIIQMYRMRRRKSTVNTLIVNLATADVLVTFFCMGTEAIWASTVQWFAGDFMCKAVKFAQVFALNLSTCITVVISLDRCFVILDPMSRNKAPQRVRSMILISWCLCAVFSIPQMFVFKVEQGPFREKFVQCVDHGYAVAWGMKVYSIVSVLFGFIIPLLIMGTAYGLISGTITRKSRDFREPETSSTSSDTFRGQVRSHLFRKAKRKALRMSIMIVAAFILCWTPYYVLFTCFTFLNIKQMPRKTMLALSFIGLSNSLLNPMIYGAFNLCKVHSTGSVGRRSWRRKDWPSFSMKSKMTRKGSGDQPVDSPLIVPNNGQFAVIKQKKNVVVICQCEEEASKTQNSKPCLFVLYKVDPKHNHLQVVDSLSDV